MLGIPRKSRRPDVLTCGKLAQAFKAFITSLGYTQQAYTCSLHSLRAGGASTSFAAGVDYVHISAMARGAVMPSGHIS